MLDEDPAARRRRRIGTAGLATMGVLHFAVPTAFDRIIPAWVPGSRRFWTYASGAAELTSAALLVSPRTRRIGGWAAAATFVGVYPANVQLAIDNAPTTTQGLAMWLRLPLQIPMIRWALGQAGALGPAPAPDLTPGTSGRA